MENWKALPGYSGIYEVSDLGRIRSVRKSTNSYVGRVLKPAPMTSGYDFVTLCVNGKTRIHSVHRLVASAFIGPCPDGLDVNHKNGLKRDNRADNLEYMSRSENIVHRNQRPRRPTSLRGHMLPNAKLDEQKVKAIKARISAGESLSDIAKTYGVVRQVIWGISKNKTWKWVN